MSDHELLRIERDGGAIYADCSCGWGTGAFSEEVANARWQGHVETATDPDRMALEAEVQQLRSALEDQNNKWFYLHCHPEHVKEIVNEVLFGAVLERDSYGHVLTEPGPRAKVVSAWLGGFAVALRWNDYKGGLWPAEGSHAACVRLARHLNAMQTEEEVKEFSRSWSDPEFRAPWSELP